MSEIKIDHIGIAVRSLEARLPFWAESLGLEVSGIETVDTEQVKVAFLPAGDARIELLEPTAETSSVAGFLDKRGEGIHHLTLAVPDIDAAVRELRQRDVSLVGDAPRPGAGGTRVAFVHPKAAGGVLIELVERVAMTQRRPQSDIRCGDAVLVYIRDPQEKAWGVLRRLDAAGIVVEGIDLGSFDEWIAEIEDEEEGVVGPSVMFVPMARVEKILLDRSSGQLPSLADRFARRIGRTVQEVLAEGSRSDG